MIEYDKEVKYFTKAANAFRQYTDEAVLRLVTRRRQKVLTLEGIHRKLAENLLLPQIAEVEKCISVNQSVLTAIVDRASAVFFENPSDACDSIYTPSEMDRDKVHSTLRQMVREWSKEGEWERATSYDYVIAELEAEFRDKRSDKLVITPGCGLGRLPYEIAKRGFNSQGNEFSCHMLFASDFLLNHCTQSEQWCIYPFVNTCSNHKFDRSRTRPVMIPDECPADKLHSIDSGGNISMSAGAFEDSYEDEQADAIVTVFFIDTSPNIFETIEAITRIMKPGGLWINLGPLMWHYESVAHDPDFNRSGGLEFSMEKVIEVIKAYGWVFEKYCENLQTTYCADHLSYGSFFFNCDMFVARKPVKPSRA